MTGRDRTNEELRQTAYQIILVKASGLDDMHAISYKKCWYFVVENISLFIIQVFSKVWPSIKQN